jgi:hypothetical protein
MGENIVNEALRLHSLGFNVLLTDSAKNPGVVPDWPNFIWTPEKFVEVAKRRKDVQVGLRLWPLVDVEIDAPADDDGTYLIFARDDLRELVGDDPTTSWTSRRGEHHLFRASQAQQAKLLSLQCPTVLKFERLEIRLGCGGAAQSLIPPSTTDGFKREWTVPLEASNVRVIPERLFAAIVQSCEQRFSNKQSASADDDEPILERPGDVFNETSTWDEVLVPHGWRPIQGPEYEVRQWTRPGKNAGVSGTTGFCKSTLRHDCFYSFSTSPEILPFESQRSYSKFEAFTALEFDGDFSLASAELARRGYTPDLPDGTEFGPLEEAPVIAAAEVPPPVSPPAVNVGLADFVYENPLGHYVLTNDPHTEADRDSVLLQSWELFGNYVGRGAKFRLNNTTIFPNGYLAIVGKTALGRKGTALQDALAPYRTDHPDLLDYAEKHVLSGISSGEGIISAVADKPGGTIPGEGRLMATMQEFHRLMTVLKRTESTLSSVLREAYDGGSLSVITKNNPLTATQAHVSMIIHTTEHEFVETVSNVDIFNGVLNRVMFFSASDGKTLPNPGQVDSRVLAALAERIVNCGDWAENNGEGRDLYWAESAVDLWTDFYATTRRATGDGHSDAILARASTQVIKLAMRHAILDLSEAIEVQHLQSAIEIHRRCRDCAIQIMRRQNPHTDAREKLLDAVRDSAAGLTKTECHKVFMNRESASSITDMLENLVQQKKIQRTKVKRARKTVDVWIAI